MSVEENTAASVSTPVDETPSGEAPQDNAPAPAPEPTQEPTQEPAPEAAPEPTPEPEADKVSEEPEKDSATELPDELYFNGESVSVEVPEELAAGLSDAGVDVNSVVAELYGKDSDFTLSEETRAPLDKLYGKAIVDTYLSALKSQNENALKGAKDQAVQAEQAEQQALEWSNEVVGGEGEWDAMSSWAENSLEESELESFNKAMQSGDKWMQELAIKALHSKFRSSEGDTEATLITGDNTASGDTDRTPLSSKDYMDAMTSKEFMELRGADRQKAQQALDARRRSGINRGL